MWLLIAEEMKTYQTSNIHLLIHYFIKITGLHKTKHGQVHVLLFPNGDLGKLQRYI